MDITLIAIAIILLLAIVLLILFLLKSINKQSFAAEDGSVFETQSDLDSYLGLYEKTKPLFALLDANSSSQEALGFERSFLLKLKNGGFDDLKSLIKYRTQIKLLSELINT